MKRTCRLLSITLLILSVSNSQGAQFDSAVIHIGVVDTGENGIDNIVTFLQADSRFNVVANIDVDATAVPTLAQLAGYDSVLIATDSRLGTITGGGLGTQLGNVLDDYVLGGGRVVLTAFASSPNIGVDGDILTLAPHSPLGPNAPAGPLNMGTAVISHFIFQGVSSFASEYAGTIGISERGIKLASYDTGTIGILTVADDSVMFVNAFPGHMASFNNGSSFGLVFANALAPIPEPSGVILTVLALLSVGGFRGQSKP